MMMAYPARKGVARGELGILVEAWAGVACTGVLIVWACVRGGGAGGPPVHRANVRDPLPYLVTDLHPIAPWSMALLATGMTSACSALSRWLVLPVVVSTLAVLAALDACSWPIVLSCSAVMVGYSFVARGPDASYWMGYVVVQPLLTMLADSGSGRMDVWVFTTDALLGVYAALATEILGRLYNTGDRRGAWTVWCLLVGTQLVRQAPDVLMVPSLDGAIYLELANQIYSWIFMVDFPPCRDAFRRAHADPSLPMVIRVWWGRLALAIAGGVVMLAG